MPLVTLEIHYQTFRQETDEDAQLFQNSNAEVYWSQGHLDAVDLLIPLTARQVYTALAGFMARKKIPLRSSEVLLVDVTWRATQADARGHFFAVKPAISVHRRNFGETLKRLRRDAGLSQFKLAALASVDISTISHVERGETRFLRQKTASALAQALSSALHRDVSVNDLGIPVEE